MFLLSGKSYLPLKRLLDIVGSCSALLVFSPLMLLVAHKVKKNLGSPVIFAQRRPGLGEKPFLNYKFRTMKDALDKNGRPLPDEERLTPFGKKLRSSSLDELPELWNVLRGDMSLIGPRPEIPYFVERFRETVPLYMVKNQVRPGITGWAQVNGFRGDTSIPKRIEHDIWYIENWSFGLDMKIILMTLFGGMVNREKM